MNLGLDISSIFHIHKLYEIWASYLTHVNLFPYL